MAGPFDRIVGIDTDAQLPNEVRARLAANLGDASTPEGLQLTTSIGEGVAPVEAEVAERFQDMLSVTDMIASWWSSPRIQWNAERKMMMVSGVSRNGMEGYALIDAVSGAQRFMPLRKTEADDHNVAAVLMGESIPPIVASTRHGADNLVKVYRGDYPWHPESTALAAPDRVTVDLNVGEATTYAHIFTKAGDTQVGLVATRSSAHGIVAFRTTDGFQTFSGPFQFLPFGYGTFRRDPGSNVIHYAIVQNNPGAGGSSLQVRYCKIDLLTGAATSYAGVALANIWTDALPAWDSGWMIAQASMSDVQLYTLATAAPVRNVVRMFDVNSNSDVIVAQGRIEDIETGWQLNPAATGTDRYGYGVLRRNGSTDARSSYVYEEIASTGIPTHYAQSGYYGGATFGSNRNEVFLSREAGGVFYLEQWIRDDSAAGTLGAWSLGEVMATREADEARISRPWYPNTGDASPYLMWDEMTTWDMSNFTTFQARKRLQLIPS